MKLSTRYLSSKNLYNIVLHVVVVVLAAEVIVLSRQNNEFKKAANHSEQVSIQPGDTLGCAGILPLDSMSRAYSSSERQVVFVFATKCPFCKEIVPVWNKIGRAVQPDRRIALFGICLDAAEDTRAFVREHRPDFPIFIVEDREAFVNANRLHGVPQTIIASSVGRVEKVWKGRLTENHVTELLSAVLDSASIQQKHITLKGGVK